MQRRQRQWHRNVKWNENFNFLVVSPSSTNPSSWKMEKLFESFPEMHRATGDELSDVSWLSSATNVESKTFKFIAGNWDKVSLIIATVNWVAGSTRIVFGFIKLLNNAVVTKQFIIDSTTEKRFETASNFPRPISNADGVLVVNLIFSSLWHFVRKFSFAQLRLDSHSVLVSVIIIIRSTMKPEKNQRNVEAKVIKPLKSLQLFFVAAAVGAVIMSEWKCENHCTKWRITKCDENMQ